MKIAGIDIGTTACKVSLYDVGGAYVRGSEREYPARALPAAGELDMTYVFAAVKEILREVAPDCGDLLAVGVTSFGETWAPLDDHDRPLMNAMLYTNPCGAAESDELAERLGVVEISGITGAYPNAMYSLPKLIWTRKNRPDVMERARHIMLVEDYVVFCLSGVRQIDYSLACRTMAFDVEHLCWSEKMLAQAGVTPEMMSKPVPTGTVAGPILPDLARELGLPETVKIVSGCHDQIAACIGAGVLSAGQAVDGSGTVQSVNPIYDFIPDPEKIQLGRYAVVPFVKPGAYISYAFSFTGGALLKWFRDKVKGRTDDPDFYEEMNARMEDGPTGLLVLPHFAGAGTPYMEPAATGAILGLTTSVTDAMLYRALMEGVAYEMRVNLRYLEKAGVRVTSLVASGGGAKSKEWLQIKADVLGLPVTTLGTAQCGTLGSIMLSGVACGVYESLDAAAPLFVKPGRTYKPRPEAHAKYDALFARYERAYEAMRQVWA